MTPIWAASPSEHTAAPRDAATEVTHECPRTLRCAPQSDPGGSPRTGGSTRRSRGTFQRSPCPRRGGHSEIPRGGGSARAGGSGIFSNHFSRLLPVRPPRCRPRQAWSRAGRGVMRLRQSLPARPPAAPGQPQGERRGSLAGTQPRVTPGQAALTPSLRVPTSRTDASTSVCVEGGSARDTPGLTGCLYPSCGTLPPPRCSGGPRRAEHPHQWGPSPWCQWDPTTSPMRARGQGGTRGQRQTHSGSGRCGAQVVVVRNPFGFPPPSPHARPHGVPRAPHTPHVGHKHTGMGTRGGPGIVLGVEGYM